VSLDLHLIAKSLSKEPVFDLMWNTVEDSPYHREENVLVHTKMVCQWYRDNTVNPKYPEWYGLGYLACALHDVAKPTCRTLKENKQRGTYYSYDKHDVVGARMSEEILVRAGAHEFDIYRISWMIRHHQIFWSTKKRELREDMARILVERDFYLPFKYFMLADDFGRIADSRDLDSFEHFRLFEQEFHIRTSL